ncbi:hypothetical protein J6590_069804 [Homalodisca vitripennis]|nr:hypothetical protein J6590_069804 [Homalodisca vitripennis]
MTVTTSHFTHTAVYYKELRIGTETVPSVAAISVTGLSSRTPHEPPRWGDQTAQRKRVGQSRAVQTKPEHAADSDLSSERF